VVGALLFSLAARADDEAPNALIKRPRSMCSTPSGTSRSGRDTARVVALVDSRILPDVNFQRMTAAAVGPAWRQATPEQQKRLQDEFKILLVRSYSGALAQVTDQTTLYPPACQPRRQKRWSCARNPRQRLPIQLDYRLEKRLGRVRDGKSTTSMCWASGWWRPTAASLPRRSNAKGIDGLMRHPAANARPVANARRGVDTPTFFASQLRTQSASAGLLRQLGRWRAQRACRAGGGGRSRPAQL